jgi:outer membrane protein OmpA-like peptidoglycan-associated protein/opacity protein-like surface antigen
MIKQFFLGCFICLFACVQPALAQKGKPASTDTGGDSTTAKPSMPTPKSMFEVGLNGGFTYMGGDVKALPSYAVGLHFRKALDYVFSLRGDFIYGELKGADDPGVSEREFKAKWRSGSLLGVISLNSLNWNKSVRPVSLYAMAGVGGNIFDGEAKVETPGTIPPVYNRKQPYESKFATHAVFGAGLSFRISERMNIGLEEQAFMLFGSMADLVDGINRDKFSTQKSSFRDIVSVTNLTINFNIGNPASQSEPLYWVNPIESVLKDIDDLKNRTEQNLTDSDQDGVLDALDQELNTPPGAIVDTKGRTLDSDRDGVPDYKDREPFYTPAEGEEVNEEGVVTNPKVRPGGVTEDRVRELIDEALQQNAVLNDTRNTSAEWFLPMIHFGTDNATVKYTDYGNLASVARTLRANPNLRLVVTGFADATGSEAYNNQLSFNRALAVIDHLTKNHNIERNRLVVQWKGSNESLVPVNASFMNRRVEFRVAGPGDVDMEPPTGKKSDGY